MSKKLLVFCLVFIVGLLSYSCSAVTKTQVQYIEKEVFVKCPAVDIPKTKREDYFQDIDKLSYPEKLLRILKYALALEIERDALREHLEICTENSDTKTRFAETSLNE